MKLLFTEPHTDSIISMCYLSDLFEAYLGFHGIIIGEHKLDWTITYNDFYKFYDVCLFEIPDNNEGSADHIKETITFLRNAGLKIKVSLDFRHDDDGTRINGKRIWIYVKAKS